MVEKILTPGRNVVDFASYQQGRKVGKANALVAGVRSCRHCGAALGDGESEDECSSAGFNVEAPRGTPRKFYAE
ncbi:MAG TPA: hypothetical protein VGO49_10650 [Bradyrhizobium sp.]|jgi:hypothetical protein|nr:hypothetical protein [Bradyrhizobium sp.]